jgi:nucleotide-binding universal stress UspA family protein
MTGIHVAAQQPKYQYRSLLDPEITVTNPSGERVKQSKPGIHPATSFDQNPNSGPQTPMDSDVEADMSDIKRAQRLSFSISQIMNTPESQRTIQIITRGEYSKLVQEAEDEHRKPRKYLVATDLSDESTHALEWAIGTVLRDGDTLVAIYCVDEESEIYPDESNSVPDENKSTHGTASAPLLPHPQMAGESSVAGASPGSSGGERSKAAEERCRAVHEIGEKVTKLIRKTRLQVQVIVEVLHCKNPKHLITEVIDLVNPTLVILGSRGRSALKGYVCFLWCRQECEALLT